jgi:hypothetical protein
VEGYLRKYGDKPELCRESVVELVSRPTTHTWVEEARVLHGTYLTPYYVYLNHVLCIKSYYYYYV